MLAKKGLSAAPSAVAQYVEDVFSPYLYSGQSSGTITIDNGIDLSGEGGLVWIKQRNGTSGHQLCDTERGITNRLQTNTTGAQSSEAFLGSVTSTGFTLPANYGDVSGSTGTYASWTFRKAEKFFDVVTYTGNGSARTISHNLGSTPGMIIVKRTDSTSNWYVYHRSLANTEYVTLNSTNAKSTGASHWNSTSPTSTVFSIGAENDVNTNGATYVAYLFAHDAGGFGDAGDQSIIKCGSYTGTGAAGNFVDLGWEPQFLIIKNTTTAGTNWFVYDVLRGLVMGNGDQALFPNLSNAETTRDEIDLNATGFTLTSGLGSSNDSGATYIYIAIRRGPMKTPEAGTEVFSPQTSSAAEGTVVTTSFPVDAQILGFRTLTQDKWIQDRLRGVSTTATSIANPVLATNQTDFEISNSGGTKAWNNTGFQIPSYSAGYSTVYWNFRRAPGFFDVINFQGQSGGRTVNHNLGVSPEFVISKVRNLGGTSWWVFHEDLGLNSYLEMNSTGSVQTLSNSWNPSATDIYFNQAFITSNSSYNVIAYLFASVSGVSKVGSYTGNGSSQTINCGFTAGARFVLIKRTDSTGDWVVFDSARGIVSGNDPYLELNTTDAEVTDKDAVDTDNTGFVVNETTGPNINTNSATYIYLAIA